MHEKLIRQYGVQYPELYEKHQKRNLSLRPFPSLRTLWDPSWRWDFFVVSVVDRRGCKILLVPVSSLGLSILCGGWRNDKTETMDGVGERTSRSVRNGGSRQDRCCLSSAKG